MGLRFVDDEVLRAVERMVREAYEAGRQTPDIAFTESLIGNEWNEMFYLVYDNPAHELPLEAAESLHRWGSAQ